MRLGNEVSDKQRRAEHVLELTPVVICVFDLATERIRYITGDFTGLLGYSREEFAAFHSGKELWHADDLPLYGQTLDRVRRARDGEFVRVRYRMRRRNGEWRWLSSRVAPFRRTGNGEVRLVIGATVDITAQRQTDEALRASEERFRSYFELGLIGMAITSPEKGCLEVNDEICRILGYDRGELMNKTWAEMTHPEDVAADIVQFERVMSGVIDGYSMDKRWIRKDGRLIDSTISVRCVRREDGSVDYFAALLQDITARKETERALAASHAELERRMGQRTQQLSELNLELTREVVERRRAESESLSLRNELRVELQAMTRLHEFSTRLMASTELKPLLDEVLSAIMALQQADFGNVQLYNAEADALDLVAQRGFQQDFLDYFGQVRDTSSACGAAMRRRERVIIEDVEKDVDFAPHRAIAAAAGYRAVQSTPVLTSRGRLLGVISTHFRQPHRPSERELRLTDLYAAHAAEMIQRGETEAAILRSQQEARALTGRLIGAQEAAGKHLARELHDDFSQRLAVLGMEMATSAQREVSEEGAARVLRLAGQIGELAKDIHRISHQLHPAILDELGLAAAIRNECIIFSQQQGVAAGVDFRNIAEPIPDDVSLCLYRVAQECLRNISRHAGATEVHVALHGTANGISMEIADSGDGFDLATGKGKGGLGLVSMEERVRMLNGSFTIRSEPRQGTVVSVSIPLRGI